MSEVLTQPRISESMLFQRLRWRLLRNTWNQLVGHSLVRPVTILLCSVLVWAFVFGVSYAGFRFQVEIFKLPSDGQIIGLLLGLLFFALGVLLIFSGGLILYGSLFTAAETAFLLSKPVRAEEVFAFKFQGAMGFSSWAFVLLGSPVLIAYGLVCHSPWYFYVTLPFFFLGYVLLPGSLSALLCLLIVNYVPRRRKELLIFLMIVLAGFTVWYLYRVAAEGRAAALKSSDAMLETANNLLNRIAFARSMWLPSAWVARGLQAAGRGDFASTGYYLALIWSNGLFLYLVATMTASRIYRRGFNRLATGGDLRRRHGGVWLDRFLSTLLPFIHPGTRLLIVKDFRTFRRDPQQWGQVLLFTGLLVLYFTNIRRMFVREHRLALPERHQRTQPVRHRAVVVYLHRPVHLPLAQPGRAQVLGAGSAAVAPRAAPVGQVRFLDGGRIVALGPADPPQRPDAGDAARCDPAALADGGRADGGPERFERRAGACMPNFRETDPSKIVGGFGGTLNLVAGLGFLLTILALMGGPWHLFMVVSVPEEPRSLLMLSAVGITAVIGIVVGAVTVLLPLCAGVLRTGQDGVLNMRKSKRRGRWQATDHASQGETPLARGVQKPRGMIDKRRSDASPVFIVTSPLPG